jgi:SAM-dependent methyltransferase
VETRERQPHAILDRESRVLKAQKIEELVGRERIAGARVLDIGTGSGIMASELARRASEVVGIDVRDQRQVRDGYRFVQVEGTALPFEDRYFDVVLSNHVIEHVGHEQEQLHHLREVRRVLADDGVVYLAVPNKWIVVEPHFRLPFLSWLPQQLADRYVRTRGKGTFYDCDLPTRRRFQRLVDEARLEAREITLDAMRVYDKLESPKGPLARLLRAPEWALKPLMPAVPTLVYLLRKRYSS